MGLDLSGWPDGFPLYKGTNYQETSGAAEKWPPAPPWRSFTAQAVAFRATAYQPSSTAIEMVNAALLLRRPLLVTGKPGVGKSTLAYSVAHELGLGNVLEWSITSRTSLQMGIYNYDAIGRLQEASLMKLRGEGRRIGGSRAGTKRRDSEAIPNIGRFIRLGPLGTALLKNNRPRVLLIDEFDKSDIDLPNDLLNIFEEGRYEIPELKRLPEEKQFESVTVADYEGISVSIVRGQVECGEFPLVILTSNRERDFPPAFLRRCLRLDLPDPDADDLKQILRARLAAVLETRDKSGTLVTEIERLAEEFYNIREGKSGQPRQLATDQLINAAYAVLMGADFAKHPELKNALLRSLSED